MKENADKHLEAFVEKVLSKSNLETPSFDFTDRVMAQVEKVEQRSVISYEPLISKPVWGLIFVGFITFVSYIIYVVRPEASGWFNGIDLNTLNTDEVTKIFKGIHPSRIVAYAIGLFSLMMLIQIPFLKSNFEKRLDV